MRSWARLPERGFALLRDRETGAFLGLAALVGVAVGLGAGLLVLALELVGLAFAGVGRLLPVARWVVVVSAPVGIVLAWWIARRFAPEVAGDGVPEASAALAVRGGYLSTRSIPLKILATALTLGGGGSGGREGPIVQIGGAIGSSISRRFRLGEDQVRSLVAAGAAAGIGASFNAPIAGMLFALEVILGSFAVRHMSAIVIASVAAAVTFRSLPVQPEDLLSAASYELGDPRELLLYAGLAVVAVLVAVLFLRLLDLTESRARLLERPPWLRPLVLGLAVGVIGLLVPEVVGTGQPFVSDLLLELLFDPAGGAEMVWYALVGVALVKVVATALTLGAGASGGAFMPSLFIGATLGAGYARLVQPLWGDISEIHPGAFAVVGMATLFAAVARAPLTSLLLVFEVTQAREYQLILPLMLATTFATFVADRVHPLSVYTMSLARRGIELVRTSEVDLLDTVRVGEVMSPPTATASPDTTLEEARQLMDRHRHHGLAVVDGDGRLVGIVTVTDIRRQGAASQSMPVGEAMTRKPVTVGPETRVSEALERMAVLGVGRLPVVSESGGDRLIGMFGREDAVRAYHRALGAATGHALTRDRLRQRTEPGASYFDFRIPPGSIADGRPVKDVAWPEGSTLVAIRRGTEVLVPRGSTVLAAGDVVTAFGSEASRRAVIDHLNSGADEPTAEITLEEMVARVEESTGEHPRLGTAGPDGAVPSTPERGEDGGSWRSDSGT